MFSRPSNNDYYQLVFYKKIKKKNKSLQTLTISTQSNWQGWMKYATERKLLLNKWKGDKLLCFSIDPANIVPFSGNTLKPQRWCTVVRTRTNSSEWCELKGFLWSQVPFQISYLLNLLMCVLRIELHPHLLGGLAQYWMESHEDWRRRCFAFPSSFKHSFRVFSSPENHIQNAFEFTENLNRWLKIKFRKKFKFCFLKSLKINSTICKVLPKRFHLNGNTTGFHPQTQKLELHPK